MKTKLILLWLVITLSAVQAPAQYFEWVYEVPPIPKGRQINEMAVNSNGNIAVCGYLACGMACHGGFVKKINSSNSSSLDFYFFDNGMSLSASANSVAIDFAGNVYVSASCGTPPITLGDTTVNSNNFIFKLDTAGNVVWVKSNVYGKIVADSSGNVYVTNNFFTRKYDTNGHWKWNAVTLPNANIAIDGSKRVYLSNSDSIIKLNSSGIGVYAKPYGGNLAVNKNGNVFLLNADSLVKLDLNGNVTWKNTAISGNAIAVDNNNAVYVANTTEIKKINSTGINIVWTRSSDNAPFNFLGIDGSKNLFLAGNHNAYIDNTLCPFKLTNFSQSNYYPNQSFITKLNTHTPAPFQAALFAGFINSPWLCNLTPFSIPSFSYCLGGSSTFNANNEFRVQISADDFTTIYDIGTVDNAFIPASVAEASNYRLRVMSTDPPPTFTYSNTSSLSQNYVQVFDKSLSVSAAGNTTICSGDSVQLIATPHMGTYIWYKNNIQQFVGGNTYFAKQAGSYYCIFNGPSCDTTSNSININVNTKPPASITPQGPTTFCAGGNVTLAANSGTGLSYQWRKNALPISGATNINYVANAAGDYTVKVTNSNGCKRFSAVVTVIIPCREDNIGISEENDIRIFPVPVQNDLKLDVKNFSGKGWIYVVNTLSQTVIVKEADFDLKELKNIDMSSLSSGIYSIIVRDMEKREIIKVMKSD